MDRKFIVERLKQEVKVNPAANAMFHGLAMRKRARQRIDLRNLYNRMRGEGFQYKTTDYATVLKTMSDIGLGTLDIDRKGRVKGLKDINVTLQSIGAAACSEGEGVLDSFTPRRRYSHIFVRRGKTKMEEKIEAETLIEPKTGVIVDVIINGKHLKIQVPKEFTVNEIAALIDKLNQI